MKVWVSVRKDIEIDVSAFEILSQLPGEADSLELPEEVTAMLSRCMSCLISVPDETLESLQPDVRTQVARYLREQADRYKVKAVTEVA